MILNYDLQILPILMEYENCAGLAVPKDAFVQETVAAWIDDQLLQFVPIYLSLHENQYYVRSHTIEDPITQFAAGAKLEVRGKTHYFIGEETLRPFQEQQATAT